MKKISNNNEEDSSLSNVITMDGGKINNLADGLNKSSSMENNSIINNETSKDSNFKKIELRKYVFYILACVSILLVFISYKSYNNFIKKEAIIFSSSLPVNSEPTDNIKNKKLFNLSLGTKVEVVKTNNDWIYIKLNDGRKGWIRENDVKRLN